MTNTLTLYVFMTIQNKYSFIHCMHIMKTLYERMDHIKFIVNNFNCMTFKKFKGQTSIKFNNDIFMDKYDLYINILV